MSDGVSPAPGRSRSRGKRRKSRGGGREGEVALKVRTTTGKILRLGVDERTTMDEVMEAVMHKWTLAVGESGLGVIGDEGVLPLPWDEVVGDLQGGGAHLVLHGVTTYPACAEAQVVPKVHSQSQLKGLKVRLKKGSIIRLKEVTTGSTVSEVLAAIRLHENEDTHAGLGGDHILFHKGRPLTSRSVTLAEYGISPRDVVSYTAQPESATPPLVQPRVKQPATYDRGVVPMSLPGISSSPLCQFTLCSLSPIFGPVLPPSLSLPAC